LQHIRKTSLTKLTGLKNSVRGPVLGPRAPTRGAGECPGAPLFGGAALLVKRRNSKWSFMVFTTTWWWGGTFRLAPGDTSQCRGPGWTTPVQPISYFYASP